MRSSLVSPRSANSTLSGCETFTSRPSTSSSRSSVTPGDATCACPLRSATRRLDPLLREVDRGLQVGTGSPQTLAQRDPDVGRLERDGLQPVARRGPGALGAADRRADL